MTPRRLPHTPRRLLLAGVLLALFLAQTLGLLHRVAHAPRSAEATVQQPVTPSPASWLQALFAGHDTERGCELYDQLSHVDLACDDGMVARFVPLPSAAVDALHPGWHLAAQAAGFLARGPPSRS